MLSTFQDAKLDQNVYEHNTSVMFDNQPDLTSVFFQNLEICLQDGHSFPYAIYSFITGEGQHSRFGMQIQNVKHYPTDDTLPEENGHVNLLWNCGTSVFLKRVS